jgi:MFS family permease
MTISRAHVQLAVLSFAIVLGMAPWFAATVVAPSMARALSLDRPTAMWLTLAVQLGFVLGSITSALLLLSDRLSPRRLAAWSAVLAAAATAVLALPGLGALPAIGLRLLTGAALAGVYPPGIKIAAGWTRERRATAIGVLVGAVTLGTASPHLLRLAVDPGLWRPVMAAAALSAGAAAVIFGVFVREGPFQSPSSPFDPRALGRVLRNRGVVLATSGYLGHMWELYAMWATIGLFLSEVVRLHGQPPGFAPFLSFVVIGIAGAAGCVLAGVWADRIGKSRVAIAAMALSASCALSIGPMHSRTFIGVVVIGLVWGFAIVADSAQFSACVTQLAPQEYVGTAVTAQTAAGFLLTMLTIRLVPTWVDLWGWTWAYAPLAIGPTLGMAAMWRLWRHHRV